MNPIKLPEQTKLSSRTLFQKQMLSNLQMNKALKALNLMIEEMSIEKGYKRASGLHYYHHLVDVTQNLLNFGIRDEVIITVGELHDAVEDTWMTKEFIQREFGEDVARYVMILTKDPNIDYKKDIDSLQKYLIDCYKELCTALVKTSDRVHNFGTLGATPLEKQLRVALETEAHFFPLFKWAAKEYPEYAAFFLNAKTAIEPHLEKIKEQAAMCDKYEKIIAEKDLQIENLKKQLEK